jgi:hypothetical protein
MPNESAQDILIVKNIDLNCNDVDEEGNSHQDFFQVKWDSYPQRIRPGLTRRMPRYLAEHFAKHLADHVLIKKETSEGKVGLINHPVERPKVLSEILVAVDEYYLPQDKKSDGEKISDEVDKMNVEQEIDLGEVPNKAVGVLAKGTDVPVDEEKSNTEAPVVNLNDENKLPSINELRKACKDMGIEVLNTDTKEVLAKKLREF